MRALRLAWLDLLPTRCPDFVLTTTVRPIKFKAASLGSAGLIS
jgi:hypothetical protein